MKPFQLQRRQWLPHSRETVFAFFENAENLQAITPPELQFKIKTRAPIEMKSGTRIDYTIKLNGIPMKWKTEIIEYNPPSSFIDLQIKGPYKLWHHKHIFEEINGGTMMHDIVDYLPPGLWLGSLANALFIKNKLKSIFDFRAGSILEALKS